MGNTIIINSVNILKFGFVAILNLKEKKLYLKTADLTVFSAGGVSNIQGIFFEVLDPSDMELASINTLAFDPATQNQLVVNLTSGFSIFGFYKIRGVIRDADGREYEVKLPIKEVCMPDGFANGVVPAKLDIEADCDKPEVAVYDKTNYSYKGQSPEQIIKAGTLYYPPGTLSNLPFTATPFSVSGSGKVFTGRYTVNYAPVAQYNIGDGFSVEITYSAKGTEKLVTCNSQLSKILCCVYDLQSDYDNDPYSSNGKAIKLKLDKAMWPMLRAFLKEKSGKDASKDVEEIAELLNCDCGCSDGVEGRAIISGGTEVNNIVIAGTNAATVSASQNGSTTNYIVNVKTISLSKAQNDVAFDISRVETAGSIAFTIGFNYPKLAETILNTIQSSEELTELLLSIIGDTQLGIDLSSVNGRCVIAMSSCSYSLIESNLTGKSVGSILIAGNTYNAPNGLLATNQSGIAAWLNGLGKGTFIVNYDSSAKTLSISSANNANLVNTIRFILGGADIVRLFSRQCVSIQQFLQAIVDYVCAFDISNVLLGSKISYCLFDTNGKPKKQDLAADQSLDALVAAILAVQCDLVNKVSALTNIDCATITSLFKSSELSVNPAKDTVLAKLDGNCVALTYDQLIKGILSRIASKAELHDLFCALAASCTVPVCDAPVNVTAYIDLGDVCAPVTGITGSASGA